MFVSVLSVKCRARSSAPARKVYPEPVITARIGPVFVMFDGAVWFGPPGLSAALSALTPLAVESVPTSDPFPALRLAREVLALYGDGSIESADPEDPEPVAPGQPAPPAPTVL